MLTFFVIYVVALVILAPLLVKQFREISQAFDQLGRQWLDGVKTIAASVPRRPPVEQRIERLERDLGIRD